MNWKDIKDSQQEKQFFVDGKPVFKKFKSLLKFHAPGLAPVEDESGWYHITAEGEPLYSERYLRTFGYYCGFAAVTAKDGCFHIGTDGKPLYAERYAWCGNFQENICTVRDFGNNYFHIGADGRRLYESNFVYAGDFRDDIACVKCTDGFCRHIDSKGNFINDKAFLDIGVFHKNIAPARDEKGWFHSDINGNALYNERYLNIEPFYNGFALVTNFDWSKKVINEKGETIVCI